MKQQYVFLALSFLLCLLGILFHRISFKVKSPLNRIFEKIVKFCNKHYKKIIILLLIVVVFTSLYQLGNIPYGYHIDEAGMAYDALSLSRYGVDRYLNKFPVYLINFGGGQSVMYAYLAAILIKVFGYSMVIIRVPAVLLRLLMVLSVYSLLKEFNNKRLTLVILLLLAICPYFIMSSRWGLDCSLLLDFLTISFCVFIKAIKNSNNKLLVLSGICFGLSLYNYALSYLMIPCILFFTLIYLLIIKKITFKQIVILGIPIFLLAIPLMLMILVNNNIIDEFHGWITIPKLPGYRSSEIAISNISKNFYILKSILTYDNVEIFNQSLVYNAVSEYGTLYYFSIPFAIIGFFLCIKGFYLSIIKKEVKLDSFFVIWFLSIILCMLIIKDPNINKANAVFMPLTYFIGRGILGISKSSNALFILIIIGYLINFSLFYAYYFYQYNDSTRNQVYFMTDFYDAMNYSDTLGKKEFYIEENIVPESYIYPLLLNRANPYEYNKTKKKNFYKVNKRSYYFSFDIDENKDNAIYIIRNNQDKIDDLKQNNFKYKQFGNYYVFYKGEK